MDDALPVFKLIHRDDLDRVNASIRESAKSLMPWRQEFRVQHRHKGEIWIEGRSSPEREPDGSILWHGFLLDITERKRAEIERQKLEAQLRQSQKMESVGRLAGGIAHDFNNLLTAIHGNAAMLLDAELNAAEKNESAVQIVEAAERAANLTRQLLLFSRKQAMQPAALNLNDVVARMTKMLQRILGEDVSAFGQLRAQSAARSRRTRE